MSARDTRPRADVLLRSAAMFGCSGSTLDADARAILSARMRTSSSEPGELTSAEWAFAARVTAQAASALDHDRARREVARASGWAYWPPRAPDAPRWPCMAAAQGETT